MKHLYVIKSGDLYKIGISDNPPKRIYGVKSPNGQKKELLFHYPLRDTRWVESELHGIFYEKRIEGEWFRLTEKELQRIDKFCQHVLWIEGDEVLDVEPTEVRWMYKDVQMRAFLYPTKMGRFEYKYVAPLGANWVPKP